MDQSEPRADLWGPQRPLKKAKQAMPIGGAD